MKKNAKKILGLVLVGVLALALTTTWGGSARADIRPPGFIFTMIK